MPYTPAQLEFLRVHIGVVIPPGFVEKKREAEESAKKSVPPDAQPSPDVLQAALKGRLSTLEPRVLDAQKKRAGEAQWMTLFTSAQELGENGKFAEANKILDRLDGLLAAPAKAPVQTTRGAVNYAKLLLRWREAQAQATTALAELGKQLLANSEVQADPRFARVQKLAAELPKLIPTFGEALADQLDAAANGGPDAPAHRLAAQKTIAAYRQQLTAVPVLSALEGFAQRNLGAALPSATALSGALSELESTLAAAS